MVVWHGGVMCGLVHCSLGEKNGAGGDSRRAVNEESFELQVGYILFNLTLCVGVFECVFLFVCVCVCVCVRVCVYVSTLVRL